MAARAARGQGRCRDADVTIETPIDKPSFYELAGLLTRYQLPLTSLLVLCRPERSLVS